MANDIDSVLSKVRSNKERIYALMQEAENIRSQLLDICNLVEPSCMSTRLPSAAVTRNHSPVPSNTGYDLMNSPIASTIYLGRSIQKSRINKSLAPISQELDGILTQVSSSVHRNALIAIEKYGVDVIKWKRGFTALHWAYREGLTDVINYLINRGADENALDELGKKPIDYRRIDEGVARMTLPKLVDLASLPLPQRKALEAIARYGWETLKWSGGFTILHWAYQSHRDDVINYCKLIGMPSTLKDDRGKLPQDYTIKS